MPRTRGLALLFFLVSSLLVPACSDDPPEKEMQQAQAAIDVARSVGANDYAHEELIAAEDSLKHAREAASQRDYRQALTSALDSRERAQGATTQSAEQKAVARKDAKRLLDETVASLARAHARLKTAETARPVRRALATSHQALERLDQALQEARAAIEAGSYISASATLKDINSRLTGVLSDLETAAAPPPRRRR